MVAWYKFSKADIESPSVVSIIYVASQTVN